MPQIKAILIDDEPDNIRTLDILIARYCQDVSVVATFTDPKAALRALPKADYDLLLLDIEMPGMTGFDLLRRLSRHPAAVIFVTAHSSYAVKAFKFNAIDYLLKPVDVDDLTAALDKYRKNRTTIDPGAIRRLLDTIEHLSKPAHNKLAISTQDGVEFIATEDIIYLRADRNYTHIKRSDKKDLIAAKTLGDFEDVLSSQHFMRINKQYMINLHKVSRYTRTTGLVTMSDGTEIQVSRTRKEDFLSFLNI